MPLFGGLFRPKVEQLAKQRNIPGLISALTHQDYDVHHAAFEALIGLGDSATVDALIAALSAPGATCRLAASALGRIGDVKAVPGLIEAVRSSDENLRYSAAGALGRLKDDRAIPALMLAVRQGDRDLREAAVEALGAFADPQVIPALVAALSDKSADVRAKACAPLGRFGRADALIKALGDKGDEVRREAEKALRACGSSEAQGALAEYEAKLRTERARQVTYFVGKHLVGKGVYGGRIGTEQIGWFDPMKVAFRAFDERGRQLKLGSETAFALDWPPTCATEAEQDSFTDRARTLAVALRTHGKMDMRDHTLLARMMLNPLGDPGTLVKELRRVGSGEVDQFILESTVLPFFQRYSKGKILIVDEVATEVSLNALLNFLCTEVVPGLPELSQVGPARVREHAIRAVGRSVMARVTLGQLAPAAGTPHRPVAQHPQRDPADGPREPVPAKSAGSANPRDIPRLAGQLSYVVGRHLAEGAGTYRKGIGTELVGHFHPLRVAFRLFNKHGRRVMDPGSGQEGMAFDWVLAYVDPQERDALLYCGTCLAAAFSGLRASQIPHSRVVAHGAASYTLRLDNVFSATSYPVCDPPKLLAGLLKVGEGEVDEFILESTVLPFLQRYSTGDEICVNDELVTEVHLNALLNFVCTEAIMPLRAGSPEAKANLDEIRAQAVEAVRRGRERHG